MAKRAFRLENNYCYRCFWYDTCKEATTTHHSSVCKHYCEMDDAGICLEDCDAYLSQAYRKQLEYIAMILDEGLKEDIWEDMDEFE